MKRCGVLQNKYYISWTGFLLAFGAYGVGIRDRLNQVFNMNLVLMIRLILPGERQSWF
jgi:hypothetical protein